MDGPATLADHLDKQTDAIIEVWRATVEQVGNLPEAERLSWSEFADHIPELLDRMAERLRGHPVDVVAEGRQHGYGIAAAIRRSSGDELVIEEGALYHALHRMERQGWLASTWRVSDHNRRAKYYALTAAGRRQLARESREWSRYNALIARLTGAGGSRP